VSVPAVLVLLIAGSLVTGQIASQKGRSFAEWTIFGLLLLVVALPIALLMKDNRRRCPACFGHVHPSAYRCSHCGKELTAAGPETV
jgi:DNA-directed RNA polymerase subunit RPC12/RpoP